VLVLASVTYWGDAGWPLLAGAVNTTGCGGVTNSSALLLK
jgi:hypothetical protein